ncbi:MAG: type II toxin-antitoxin system ParD family antitoxin [Myxococcales bacterium]|nr:type II toxin-antitoxin system ParD family antitoxin [Myxococcales bacterium]
MAKNTSISLGRHFDGFIRRQVAGGRYGTASEVVRAGLRLLEEEDAKLAALRAALDEGESSGFAEDYSLEALLAEKPRKKR